MGAYLREVSLASARQFNAAVAMEIAGSEVKCQTLAAPQMQRMVAFVAQSSDGGVDLALMLPQEAATALVDHLLGDESPQGLDAGRLTRVDRTVLTAWMEGTMRPALASRPAGETPRRWSVRALEALNLSGTEGLSADVRGSVAAVQFTGHIFLSRQTAKAAAGATRPSAKLDAAALADALVTVTATLGRITVSLGEARSLEPGDVVLLDHEAPRRVMLDVGGTPWGEGRAGVKAGRLAVEITSTGSQEPRADG